MGAQAVLVATITLLTGYLAIVILSPYAKTIGLVDLPNHRKQHSEPTALVGGLSVFIALALASLVAQPLTISLLTYLGCSAVLVTLGVLDDRQGLSPNYRLAVESLIALIMCFLAGLYLNDLGNLVGFGDIHLEKTGYVLTVIAVIAAINAFNMIDGIDGLLGITALVTFWAMGVLFYSSGDYTNLQFVIILMLALLPYLAVNLQLPFIKHVKIFMGDTGSMLIGFTVVWLLIQGTQVKPQSFSATTALWLIGFPLMDMVRVMLGRYLQGKSIFEADRTHLHHVLLDYNRSRHNALLKIIALVGTLALVGVLLEVFKVPENISVTLFILTFLIYSTSINLLTRQIKKQAGAVSSI